jgi:hypothetical protein
VSCVYGTNEFHPDLLESILKDPEDVAKRIIGSKIVVGSNQAYLLTLWGVKACLLMLYFNMTKDTRTNIFVKLVMGYTLVGFVALEISYLFVFCRPFSDYWRIDAIVTNTQCANYYYGSIIQLVFNISSDFLMLLLPLPLIFTAKVPPLKRCLLVGIFSLGIFVILAAILNKYYNFTMPHTTVYMVWHIREASVSIYVANIMCWWPLLRKMFGWKRFLLGSSTGGTYDEMGGSNRRSEVVAAASPGSMTPLHDIKPVLLSEISSPPTRDSSLDMEVGEVHVYGRAY